MTLGILNSTLPRRKGIGTVYVKQKIENASKLIQMCMLFLNNYIMQFNVIEYPI